MPYDVQLGFAKGDQVVTPSGELAVVQSITGAFLLLEYLDPIEACEATLTLHERLVRRREPGKAPPAPVTIGNAGEVAARRVSMRRSRW